MLNMTLCRAHRIGMSSWVLTTNPLEQSFSQSLWNIYINNIVIFGWGWLINIVMSIPQKHCVLSRAVVKRQFRRKLGRKGELRTKLSNKEALKALHRGKNSLAQRWRPRRQPDEKGRVRVMQALFWSLSGGYFLLSLVPWGWRMTIFVSLH